MIEVDGYKGYRLVESDQPGSCHLVSPTGVKVAVFYSVYGSELPRALSLVGDELDCGSGHRTQEHMIRHIVRAYERLHTTRWQRAGRAMKQVLFRTALRTIVTIVGLLAGLATILAYLGISI